EVVLEAQQVRKPQRRLRGIANDQRLLRGREARELGVGGAQHHDLGRRLAEIDRLGSVRGLAGSSGQEVHWPYASIAAAMALRSRPLRPITTSRLWRGSPASQGRSK